MNIKNDGKKGDLLFKVLEEFGSSFVQIVDDDVVVLDGSFTVGQLEKIIELLRKNAMYQKIEEDEQAKR